MSHQIQIRGRFIQISPNCAGLRIHNTCEKPLVCPDDIVNQRLRGITGMPKSVPEPPFEVSPEPLHFCPRIDLESIPMRWDIAESVSSASGRTPALFLIALRFTGYIPRKALRYRKARAATRESAREIPRRAAWHGLDHLKGFNQLRYLDLSGSPVTGAGFATPEH